MLSTPVLKLDLKSNLDHYLVFEDLMVSSDYATKFDKQNIKKFIIRLDSPKSASLEQEGTDQFKGVVRICYQQNIVFLLLVLYVLATSKVISGWVQTCDRAHSG